MRKIWSEYIDHFDAFDYVLRIPVNIENYKSQIKDFQTFFLKAGFKWGIYKFESLIDGNIYDISTIINDYLSNTTDMISKTDGTSISMFSFTHWDFFLEFFREGKEVISVISVPLKEDSLWISKNFNLSSINREGEEHSFPLLFYYSVDYDINDLKKSKEEKLYFNMYSRSNVWFDEIGVHWLEDDDLFNSYIRDPTFYDTPISNRPTAYRITPRFNSFWRDIKNKVIDMGGEVEVDLTTSGYRLKKTNEEGYILLDGQVIFQEDIDSGKIKMPD